MISINFKKCLLIIYMFSSAIISNAQCESYKPIIPLDRNDFIIKCLIDTFTIDYQFYDKSKLSKIGEPLYLGHDLFLLEKNMLIEATRINYEINSSVRYEYNEEGQEGQLNLIQTCFSDEYCSIIVFYENGKIKNMFQINKEGKYEGWKFSYGEFGNLVSSEFYENGEIIERP